MNYSRQNGFFIGQRFTTSKGAPVEVVGFHTDGQSPILKNLTTGQEALWKPEWFEHLKPDDLRNHALLLLRQALNQQPADFRDGQWEAIECLLRERSRLLVVQRTGWGKSLVYFVATRLLRDRGEGCTLLISPLLALIRNQIEAAQRIQVKAESINSDNQNDWSSIQKRLLDDQIDILLISPERLANPNFRDNILQRISNQVGLFVVDEAHCISDWGHDFRPDYQRITRILQLLPPTVPVLATTATANNRVVKDIKQQLGESLQISRGALTRASLRLQAIELPDQAARLAWLAQHLPTIPGSGIVYALTKRDTEQIANWLTSQRIDAAAYHSDLPSEHKQELEDQLLRNGLKVLVATVALGMGFDKPDLAFVIHYQRPGSVVHYYQQVGRAGRAVEQAYGILLSGIEDQEITDYFIESAFPPEAHIEHVLTALGDAEDGLSLDEMEEHLNLSKKQIEKVLKMLENTSPSPVIKQNKKYYATPIVYQPDREKIARLTQIRQEEQAQMLRYVQSKECLMLFLSQALDDPFMAPCGRCASCIGQSLLPTSYSKDLANQAVQFLQKVDYPIKPRQKIPPRALATYGWHNTIPQNLRAQEGRCLSVWGDIGWGQLVKQGKFHDGYFDDVLVEAVYQMIRRWNPRPFPTWLTCVPSLNRPELVPNLAERLSKRLKLPFVPCIQKIRVTQPQKEMRNSFQQSRNLDGAFVINPWSGLAGSVFLIDDVIDSGWTLTILAALLRQAGSGAVFPIALANSSTNG
jgi:ATP-dependent DNA helicase RecQ